MARFNRPSAIARGTDGTLYVTDRGNHTIRRISPGGVVSTLAGTAGATGQVDGTGASARLGNIAALIIDKKGVLYFIDRQSGVNGFAIRSVDTNGVVTTIAQKLPGYPDSLAIDARGTFYFANYDDNAVTWVDHAGYGRFAGNGQEGHADGSASKAMFSHPTSIAIDADGLLYVMDGDATLRTITPTGVVHTVAGTSGQAGAFVSAALPGNLPHSRTLRALWPKQLVIGSDGGIMKIVLP